MRHTRLNPRPGAGALLVTSEVFVGRSLYGGPGGIWTPSSLLQDPSTARLCNKGTALAGPQGIQK